MTHTREVSVVRALHLLATGLMVVALSLSVACSGSPRKNEARFLERGKALIEKHDYARALLEFKNASLAMPKDAEPYFQMGNAYLALGNGAEGIAYLRKATELNPGHREAQMKLAELMTSSNNKQVLTEATGRLQELLSTSPENPEANDALALAEWKLGKTEEATVRLEDTLKRFPSHLQTSMELARVKVLQKDLTAAEQILKKAVESAPQSSSAELALGQLYMLTNEPGKAEIELRKAVQLDSRNGAALLGLAAIQIAANRIDEADQTYRQIASLPAAEFKPLHALFLYKVGKRDAALAEFEALVKRDPNDRAMRSRLLAAYVAMGKTDAAWTLLAAVLKKNPKDADALFERASLSLRSGNSVQAEKDLMDVLRFKPEFAEAHAAMAVVYKSQNQGTGERRELNEALRINPQLLQARLMLARNLTRSNEGRASLELLNNTPAQQKGLLPVIIERNWALVAVGNITELRPILDQALSKQRVPELVIQDAVVRLQRGDYAGARADAEEVLQKNSGDIRAVRVVVAAYRAQKLPAKVEERLKTAVAEHPQSAPLQTLLGQWYMETRNLTAARKAFEAAQSADPKLFTAAFCLAQIEYMEKHLDAGRQRLQAILKADPQNVSALLMLGSWAAEAGDQEEAIQHYRAAVDADGGNVAALNNLAYTLAASQPDEALQYAQRAAELAPNNATVSDTLGWIYYKKLIYSTAVTYLQTAVAKEPTARRQYHLALSYLKSGQRDLGEKTLRLALQQDPKIATTERGW